MVTVVVISSTSRAGSFPTTSVAPPPHLHSPPVACCIGHDHWNERGDYSLLDGCIRLAIIHHHCCHWQHIWVRQIFHHLCHPPPSPLSPCCLLHQPQSLQWKGRLFAAGWVHQADHHHHQDCYCFRGGERKEGWVCFYHLFLLLIYRIVIAKWVGVEGRKEENVFKPTTWAFYY